MSKIKYRVAESDGSFTEYDAKKFSDEGKKNFIALNDNNAELNELRKKVYRLELLESVIIEKLSSELSDENKIDDD